MEPSSSVGRPSSRWDLGGYTFDSLFDGLGKINRFELRGPQQEVCYTASILNSGTYQEAKRLGSATVGVLFEDTTPKRCTQPRGAGGPATGLSQMNGGAQRGRRHAITVNSFNRSLHTEYRTYVKYTIVYAGTP